jgi:hypothetical protein
MKKGFLTNKLKQFILDQNKSTVTVLQLFSKIIYNYLFSNVTVFINFKKLIVFNYFEN